MSVLQSQRKQSNSSCDYNINDVIEALQIINNHAGLFSSLSSKYKNQNNIACGNLYKYKQEALYGIKADVLDTISEYAERIEIHLMNDRDYYCLYFYTPNEKSFHRPVTKGTINSEKITDVRVLSSFSKSFSNKINHEKLVQSIYLIKNVFGIDANDYLPKKYINSNGKRHFVGWYY